MLNLVSSIFLLVNAATLRRERSILFNRLAILTLLYSVTILRIGTGIGMYGGLFQTISITHIFNLFISIIGAIVLLLTAFYPRRLQEPYPSFLAIELQSYGLYTFFGYIATICWSDPLILLLVPAVTYSNAGLQEKQIKEENKGKSGVYRWTNLVNKNTYIGSSVKLERRFRDYYKNSFLSHKKNKNMIICKALKKYGYSNFSLEILEYSEPSDVISREQYYLDLFKPEYNINPTAGSSLGYKHSKENLLKMSEAKKGENHPLFGKTHSEETKTLMRKANKGKFNPFFGKTHSEETKAKISAATKGKNHPFLGKTHSEETKAKMIAAQGQAVEVLDKETNETSTYPSGRQAAKALGCCEETIRRCIKSKKLFKERFLIVKQNP